MPRLLELFSGTKSISKVARSLGYETVSLDIDPTHGPDLCLDILHFDEESYPKDYFTYVWASPDCWAYSSARTVAKIPRDEAMAASDKLVAKTRQMIQHFGCAYCIENPGNSRLWGREVAEGLITRSVITSYCSFGFAYRKNTRLASNFPLVLPRCPGPGLCPQMIGNKHKQHAQKGGGGLEPRYKTRDELHKIPPALCKAILQQAADNITQD